MPKREERRAAASRPRPALLVFLPYCPSSIGEQVVQIPFFHFLRQAHPGAEVVGVSPGDSGEVLAELGLVDRLVPHPVHAGPRELVRLARELRGVRPAAVFLLRRKSLRTSLLARLSTRAPVTGFDHGVNRWWQQRSLPFSTSRYLGENYVQMVGKSVADFAAEHSRRAQPYALFIPGGRTAVKRYPFQKYLEVAAALSSRLGVRFLLGPDTKRETRMIESADADYSTHDAPPMSAVRELVLGASVVIANDCGPAHFAHIHDVPRVSLFDANVDPAHWFFPGAHGHFAQAKGPGEIGRIPVERVVELAESALAGEDSSIPVRSPAPGDGSPS